MSKPLILTTKSWAIIQQQISQDYPPSVLLIRSKMKSVLGFTTREHEEWVEFQLWAEGSKTRHQLESTIYLDFYNEPKRTMFLLKYSEHIEIGKTALDKESEMLYN